MNAKVKLSVNASRVRRSLLPALLIVQFIAQAAAPVPARGQIKPAYDQGALGLGRLLKRLNTSATAMMVGAHPDDEDTALLSYLARGENARTAYLSLTRGDGGQNIIGPELGEALGVIRTEELLQARKLDGAEQYFTRAYDYGFSKTLAEAREKWDEKVILCDAVRAIRSFRPLVVVSQFSGTPADGHGQHQFAGYIAPMAVRAAGDPAQCTDAGPAWQVKKLYARHRGQGEPRLRINTGRFDRMLGRSYFEIAMEARSQHRSQEQGVLELKGEAFSALNPSEPGIRGTERGVFDGLDVSVMGIAANAGESGPELQERLSKIQQAASRALAEYEFQAPEKLLPILVEGYHLAADLPPAIRDSRARAFLDQKRAEFAAALKLAAGIQVDAISDRETVVPGESVTINIRAFFPGDSNIAVKEARLKLPEGWKAEAAQPAPAPSGGGALSRREAPNFGASYTVTPGTAAAPTQPYWLQKPRTGDIFDPTGTGAYTAPLQEPEAAAEVRFTVAGTDIAFTQPIEYRYADDVRGELRRPLVVVPKVSVSVEEDLLIVPRGPANVERDVAVTVTSNSIAPVSGTLNIEAPSGVGAAVKSAPFTLGRRGESVSLSFRPSFPGNLQPGSYQLRFAAEVGGDRHSRSMRVIAYPHIQTHRIYSDAAAKANVFDVQVAPVRVGYIPGSGDRVPAAITRMGINVETIDERTLASGDLSRFDVILVGIRAYQVRQDIVAHNKRLLDFANAGGTLIVQYQLSAYAQQNLAPFPAQQGPRVADENAKVTILEAAHPVFNFPNKISDADFAGWVQERNLYNFSTMDSRYTGLLEAHDAGEPENKGGLVVADVGQGKYIYCSYSLFRQLPAGVPGAYRLLANMLAYSRGGRK
jgi:LmbE family N-acetylglucosaminyl deacetylase